MTESDIKSKPEDHFITMDCQWVWSMLYKSHKYDQNDPETATMPLHGRCELLYDSWGHNACIDTSP